jgi:hypothetical protein
MVEEAYEKFKTLQYQQLTTKLKADTWRCQLPEAFFQPL